MKRIFIVLISFVCLFSAFSKSTTSNNKTNVPFYVKPEISSYGTDPGATPEEISQRLEALPTEMEMRYTPEVQKYIDSYMKKARGQVATLQILSAYYLPIFEKALADAGLPDELKYLPIIESGLDSKATSRCGAGGLWQIMPSVAKGYDMKVNASIDERRDPYIASERACRMLKQAYEKFGDWGLALASYNCGPGNLARALKRAGGDSRQHTFWSVYNYLPAQTRSYVPKFIAMVYIMNYYNEHDIPQVKIPHYAADTIRVSSKVNLSQLAPKYNVSLADLKALNPHLHTDVVPATASRPCNVVLPLAAAQAYRMQRANPDMMIDDSQPLIATAAQVMPVSTAVKVNASAAASEVSKRHNPNFDNYEDVESTTFPGTYVRKSRTKTVNKKKSGKSQVEVVDEDDTFDFINSVRLEGSTL